MLSGFQRTGPGDFAGYAFDPADVGRRFLVEILIDGAFHCAVRADGRVFETATHDLRAPCGFTVTLPDGLMGEATMIEARIANGSTAVGAAIRLDQPMTVQPMHQDGEVRWTGDLGLAGWSADDSVLLVLVDGVMVDEVRPTVWRHVERRAGDAVARPAFTTHLPGRFADGQVHQCAVTTRHGAPLAGSPFAFLAWPDQLQHLAAAQNVGLRDRLRAQLFDSLVPAAIAFADYDALRPQPAADPPGPADLTGCGVILVGPGDTDATVTSLQAQSHPSWLAASLPPRGAVDFSAADLRAVLRTDLADAPLLVFALAGTVLHPTALARFAGALADAAAALAYGDVDVRGADGPLWPLAFPAFDRERLLEQGYCALLFAMRREAAIQAAGTGAADLYALAMAAVFDGTGMARPVLHLPGAIGTLPTFDQENASLALAASTLAHLRRQNLAGTVVKGRPGALPRVTIARHPPQTTTTVMIPTRNRRDLLETCLQSIRPALRRRDCEVLILDNDSSDADTVRFFADLERAGIRRIVVPGPFNFAHLNNVGASAATGTLLCLMNNDVRAEDADWLETLTGSLAEPDVGAVAPVLVWPSRVVQHGGLVLGPRFTVAHAFGDRLEGDPGYGDLLRVAHECSAVSAACLLTPRADYLAVGGMDESRFPINFNDVDYCLKLRAAGRRVILTPHARLIHAEASSRGRAWTEDRRRLFEQERRALQLKWGVTLADDPYYSPILALTPEPYTALSRHERAMPPRYNTRPVPREVPDGL